MTRLAGSAAAAAIAFAVGFTGFGGTAQAQDVGQGIMEVIVYGNDPCPRSTESEIVVCVRRGEEERYRIPENYRGAGPRQPREAWVNRARTLETVGATGTQSCSAVGPGGYTGCLERLIRQTQRAASEDADASVPPPAPPPR